MTEAAEHARDLVQGLRGLRDALNERLAARLLAAVVGQGQDGALFVQIGDGGTVSEPADQVYATVGWRVGCGHYLDLSVRRSRDETTAVVRLDAELLGLMQAVLATRREATEAGKRRRDDLG